MAEKKPWLKFYPEGVPASIDYPKITLPQMLKNTAKKYPNHTAIIFESYKMTYSELSEAVDRFATALHSLGISKGDKVAIFLPNIPQFVIAYYGILTVGGVVTAINPLYKEREVERQLNDSEAKAIVTLDLLYPIVEKVWEKTKVEHVIVASIKEYLPPVKRVLGTLLKKIPMRKVEPRPGVHFFKELIERYPPEPPEVEINPQEDLAVLQYTGGTTGVPKGAMLTHFNLVSNAVAATYWLRSEEAKEVHMGILPLFHIYGMTVAMNSPIYGAGTVVLIPRFDPEKILSAIEKYKITVFCGVPTLYAMLINFPKVAKYDLSSVKFCISGAAPLPPEVQKRFMELTGAVLVEGYGLTEAAPVTHANPLDPTMKTVKIGTIGIPWPDTDAKIMDAETGEKELPPGEVGELVVKGPQVMKGYWKMPEETKAVLRDGWLYTGDLAVMDEDGYFRIVDRKKDLIKYKGYSVYPRELEDVLYEHPAVKLCAVVGKPDPVAGEIPKAFIVLKPEYEGKVSEEEIIKWISERVAAYKRIREVEFRKELPVSAVGKVLRRVLRDEERRKAQAKEK
ncbi:long-chain fatty acid--CoA ligase [Candidatus Bathyarchaeota archaeon]|nr:MAG: long-chain fatty acid--CoA ligase [Candidatus Bathyarchaeota archaeon]